MKVALAGALLIAMAALFAASSALNYTYHKESMQKIDSLYNVIEQRYIIDSLYHDHLSKCAFELRDGVEPNTRLH